VSWRLSSEEVKDEEKNNYVNLPLQPLNVLYFNNRLTIEFTNAQFKAANILCEDPVVTKMHADLDNDADAEVLYKLEFSYMHPVTRDIMGEEYYFLGCSFLEGLRNPKYSYGVGATPTFSITFGIDTRIGFHCSAGEAAAEQ